MLEEFQIAKERGKIIIPIGSTEFAAKRNFLMQWKSRGDYPYLNDYWEILETEEDVIKVVNTINEIIEGVR